MILHNVLLMGSRDPADITVAGNRIMRVDGLGEAQPDTGSGQQWIDCEGSLLFAGLVNSHDHLDFNLFPQLGQETYRNYTQWGRHLHSTYRQEINAVLRVPLLLREQWGVLKNLLAGVTTVVNHGIPVKIQDPAIEIYERYHCLHSIAFEKHWRRKLNNPFSRKYPFVIHIGEGTDAAAHREIDSLLRWNWLKKPLVGVHAVAMDRRQAKAFDAIVWCPGSNFFMLNQTAQIDRLKETSTILFGTDSTLTASWNIWDHIRLARKTGLLTDEELFLSLNENAARTWKTGNGRIEPGAPASLVLARVPKGLNRMDAFFGVDPEAIRLVLQQGEIKLSDVDMSGQLAPQALSGFSRIKVGDREKFVSGDLTALTAEIRNYRPETTFPFTVQ